MLLERLDDVAAEIADPPAQPAEGGAGLVADAAVHVERAPEEIGERFQERERREGPRHGGSDRLDAAAVGPKPPGSVEQREQRRQLAALGHRAGDTDGLEGRPGFRNHVPGRDARDGEG